MTKKVWFEASIRYGFVQYEYTRGDYKVKVMYDENFCSDASQSATIYIESITMGVYLTVDELPFFHTVNSD